MAVSSRVKTQSSNKTVLPLGGDSTPVVHARQPALPHITQTLADCTPTATVREPASPYLPAADSNPVHVDTTPSPAQSSQTRAVSKAAPVPKGPVLPRRTRLHQLVRLFLWRKHNQLDVVQHLSHLMLLNPMCVSSHHGNIILKMKENASCRCSSKSYV